MAENTAPANAAMSQQPLAQLRALLADCASAPTAKLLAALEVASPPELPELLLAVLREARGKAAGGAPAAAAAAAAPAERADVAGALATVPQLSFLSPRGKHDLIFLPDRFVVRTAKADVSVPYSTVRALAIFDSIPKDTKGRMLLLLSLSTKVMNGKVPLDAVVISTQESAELRIPSPKGGTALAGPAAVVLCQAFGQLGLDPACFCSPDPAVYAAAGGAAGVEAHVKARPGFLFPLPAALAFLEVPALFVPHSEVRCVEMLRAGGASRTFDLALHLRGGGLLEFGHLPQQEAGRMEEYLRRSRLLGEPGKEGGASAGSPAGSERGSSEQEGGADDSDDSQDEDFDPEASSEREPKRRGGAGAGPSSQGEGGSADGSPDDSDAPDSDGGSSEEGSSEDEEEAELVSEDEFSLSQLKSMVDKEQAEAGGRKRKRAPEPEPEEASD